MSADMRGALVTANEPFRAVMMVNTVPPGLTVSCLPEAWRLAMMPTRTL